MKSTQCRSVVNNLRSRDWKRQGIFIGFPRLLCAQCPRSTWATEEAQGVSVEYRRRRARQTFVSRAVSCLAQPAYAGLCFLISGSETRLTTQRGGLKERTCEMPESVLRTEEDLAQYRVAVVVTAALGHHSKRSRPAFLPHPMRVVPSALHQRVTLAPCPRLRRGDTMPNRWELRKLFFLELFKRILVHISVTV